MLKRYFLLLLTATMSGVGFGQGHNRLWIPDTLTGPTFDLDLVMSSRQLLHGPPTQTHCIEGRGQLNQGFWGPTLFFQYGDTVHLNVTNFIHDTTTIHWHGFTLPSPMDGGPHQPIAPNSTWRPFFKVKNHAGFFWYHPHLHMMTEMDLTMGLGGFIIVRDSVEQSLPLPRHYGVDDLPLVLTDRRFDSLGTNQFQLAHYGDTVLTNGTLHAATTVPAQVTRLRILDAAMERSYNVGFSDNRPFWIIANDGGMLAAPVPATRFLLSVGERVEILVEFGGQQGQEVDLVAYNDEIPSDIPGAEPASIPIPHIRNLLGARRFNLLHLQVGPPTPGAITTVPTSLRPSSFPPATAATRTRQVVMSSAFAPGAPPGAGWFDGRFFDMRRIDQRVRLGATEIWELENRSVIAHPFHIHDVQFYILDRNGLPAPPYEQAWKDVVLVRQGDITRFIARFDQPADSLHPFMYHCHILFHEDAGMMGQFTVSAAPTAFPQPATESPLAVYPNPTHQRLFFTPAAARRFFSVEVLDLSGRTILPPTPLSFEHALDVSSLPPGLYSVRLTTPRGHTVTQRFTRE